MVWLFDFFLRPEHPRMPVSHRISNFFFRCIHQSLIGMGIRFIWKDTIKGQSLWLDFGWDYSVLRRIYPDYQENIARIAQHCYAKYPESPIIDIGAALGDTIFQIRNRVRPRCLAIDPHPRVLLINYGNCDDVQIVKAYVRGKDLAGELMPEVIDSSIPTLRLQEILDELPPFSTSKLLKIDTDGHDFSILRDNKDWFQKAKPILFFEYDPLWNSPPGDTGLATLSYLHEIGYDYALVYSSTGLFLASVDRKTTHLWKEFHSFLVKKGPIRYYDLCFFTADDRDLFEEVLEGEVAV